ncbi:GyrI-like domain-containing protein [Spirillospora sp. NPDC050679]
MAEQPRIVQRDTVHYAGIAARAPLTEWGEVNALVPRLYQWLAERGVAPGGGPVYRYRVIGGMARPYDLDVGVPVAAPVTPDGRVFAGTIPAGKYAVVLHHGHPDQMEKTHTSLEEWASAAGVRFAREGERWTARCESFLTDPGERPDPADWTTEIAYLTEDGRG